MVKAGRHAGTLTIEPFTSIARGAGFTVLDTSTRHFADYQGGAFMASRRWAAANPDAIKGFIRGYRAGLAWTLDPANLDAGTALLLENMPEIRPQVAGAVMASLLSPQSGLTPQGALLPAGVRTVLELRSRWAKLGSSTIPRASSTRNTMMR